MKCPKCNLNHKKKDGFRCSCGYEFALDPSVHGMADGKLLAFVRRASSNDTLYFTRNQLLTAASKINRAPAITGLFIGTILIVLSVTFCLRLFPMQFIAAIVGLVIIIANLNTLFWSRPNKEKLFTALDKYLSKHGPIEKLLESPELNEAPANNFEPDLYDYGVEKIIIVHRPLIVDLLVKNKVHIHTRSLIMTADGYPTYLQQTLQQILRESPELPVFFLHDSVPSGLSWAAQQMSSSEFNNGQRKLVDMGVSPEDIKQLQRLRGLRLKSQNYEAPLDLIPMAMLTNGIAVSLDKEISLSQILAENLASDASSNFG